MTQKQHPTGVLFCIISALFHPDLLTHSLLTGHKQFRQEHGKLFRMKFHSNNWAEQLLQKNLLMVGQQ